MKLLLTILFMPLLIFSQDEKDNKKRNSFIKISEYDKFSKNFRIESKYVTLKAGMFEMIRFRFRSVDSTIFLGIDGFGSTAGLVTENARLILLCDDDSTLTCYSKGIQSYEPGHYGSTYHHEYYIDLNTLEQLCDKTIVSFRIYHSDGYVDQDIKKQKSEDLRAYAKGFFNEYNEKILKK